MQKLKNKQYTDKR